MRLSHLVAATLAVVCGFASGSDRAVLRDDNNAILQLSLPVSRIVTLAPHLAELVFDVGAGERLIGTVEWSNNPPAAQAVPRIGDGFRVDAERVLALQPDVVLAWGGGTPASTIEQLRALNLQVAVLTPSDLASVPRHLRWLGRLTGNAETAEAKARKFEMALQTLRAEYSDRQPVDVFYQISGQPLFTVGAEHTISELIGLCGGRNIFSDLDRRAHAVSREAVIMRDPDVIVAGQYTGSGDELSAWRRWDTLTATRAGNLFNIDAERVARPATGLADGGRELCETLDEARANLRQGEEGGAENKPG